MDTADRLSRFNEKTQGLPLQPAGREVLLEGDVYIFDSVLNAAIGVVWGSRFQGMGRSKKPGLIRIVSIKGRQWIRCGLLGEIYGAAHDNSQKFTRESMFLLFGIFLKHISRRGHGGTWVRTPDQTFYFFV